MNHQFHTTTEQEYNIKPKKIFDEVTHILYTIEEMAVCANTHLNTTEMCTQRFLISNLMNFN